MTPKTVRGASTGADLRSRPRAALMGRSLCRPARSARHALLTAAVLALSAPVGLGEAATSNDAAHYIGQTADAKSTGDVRAYVADRATRNGWAGRAHRCIVALVDRENRAWNPTASNRQGSSAYGLFQILHTPVGTPLNEQWDRFARYIDHRFQGDPCAALRSSLETGSY